MICLFLWLFANTGLQGHAFWFGSGILFSLAGDVLLSFERMFLPGLVAFLLAHLSYIVGFQGRDPDPHRLVVDPGPVHRRQCRTSPGADRRNDAK